MKVPGLLLLVFLSSFVISAQSSAPQAEPRDVTVVKKSWRKEIDHPALTADPFRANDEQAELQRNQKDNGVRNAVRIREGNTPLPTTRPPRPASTESDGGPSTTFVYRTTVKNTGSKTITAIAWEYLFFDSDKVEQVGQHSFRQQVKIRPGKSMELVGRSTFPPTRVVDAAKTQQPRAEMPEEVSIREIQYEDGSGWQRPLE